MSSGVIYLSQRDLIAFIVSLWRYDIIDYMVFQGKLFISAWALTLSVLSDLAMVEPRCVERTTDVYTLFLCLFVEDLSDIPVDDNDAHASGSMIR